MRKQIIRWLTKAKLSIDKARAENREPNLLASAIWALRKVFPRDWSNEA